MIADPIFFLPTFYTLHEVLNRKPGEEVGLHTVRTALGKYWDHCFADWRNTWGVWFPGHAVTYGLMPLHLRMPWVAALSFGYLSILSFTRGDHTRIAAEEAKKREDGRLSPPPEEGQLIEATH